jgi:hypothetical protein
MARLMYHHTRVAACALPDLDFAFSSLIYQFRHRGGGYPQVEEDEEDYIGICKKKMKQ